MTQRTASSYGNTGLGWKARKNCRGELGPVIIIINKEVTYAEILRKVKIDITLRCVDESMNRIRQTKKDNLLLKYKLSKKSEDLHKKIEPSKAQK